MDRARNAWPLCVIAYCALHTASLHSISNVDFRSNVLTRSAHLLPLRARHAFQRRPFAGPAFFFAPLTPPRPVRLIPRGLRCINVSVRQTRVTCRTLLLREGCSPCRPPPPRAPLQLLAPRRSHESPRKPKRAAKPVAPSLSPFPVATCAIWRACSPPMALNHVDAKRPIPRQRNA